MKRPGELFKCLVLTAVTIALAGSLSAQTDKPGKEKKRKKKTEQVSAAGRPLGYAVSGGQRIKPFRPDSALKAMAGDTVSLIRAADSLSALFPKNYDKVDSILRARYMKTDSASLVSTGSGTAADSLAGALLPADSLGTSAAAVMHERDSAYLSSRADSLGRFNPADTAGLGMPDTTLTRRELRRLERYRAHLDTMNYRHSPFFRDSIPISRLTLISTVVPGFSQFYNGDYWKIPVLYATTGAALWLGLNQNSKYKTYKRQYDALVARDASREEIDPVQTKMIRRNTARQLLFLGAAASYLYFLGDGVINYPGPMTQVKKATTLSMICPGAGQIYNRSYWKVPIVVGGFATFIYMIDWNNRGYKRFDLAYKLSTDNDDNTVDEFHGQLDSKYLLNLRKNYRRNRDLCIILTVAWYFLQVMDAHVDSHLKDYDISDDLSFNVQPSIDKIYTTSRGSSNTVGLNFNIWF